MSLQLAAQHLASQGRGPDTTLVHMAPGEVDSLQAIAKAHGGSLTINPQTGLPEAGFLSSILPMIAGIALGPAGFGLTAMQAGLAAGAIGTVATGSLRKGIMAGLGAYGGAGIGNVISEAGANAISNAATPASTASTAVPTVAGPDFAAMAAKSPYDFAGIAGTPEITGVPTITPVAPQAAVQATPLPAYLQGTVDPMGGFPLAGAPASGAVTVDPYGGFSAARVPVPASGATTVDPYGGFGGATNIAPAQAAQAAAPAPAPAQAAPAPAPAPSTAQYIDPATSDYNYRNQMDIASKPYEDARAKALVDAGKFGQFKRGLSEIIDKPELLFDKKNMKYGAAALVPLLMQQRKQATYPGSGPNPYQYSYNPGYTGAGPSKDSSESLYFRPSYTRLAEGGSTSAAPASNPSLDYYRYLMSSANVPMSSALPDNLTAPTSNGIGAAMPTSFSSPSMSSSYFDYLMGNAPAPAPTFTVNPVNMSYTPPVKAADSTVGMGSYQDQSGPGGATPDSSNAGQPGDDGVGWANGGITAFAQGGYNLGDYSDGGRLLKGPGDGVSDSIPASIANKRPARLADGEFVVPARIVSELGNGSTEAGARKLYAMMDRVQKNRSKSIGKGKVAVNSRSDKLLPA